MTNEDIGLRKFGNAVRSQNFTIVHDFAIGAEIFLKALAKRLGFKIARVFKECPAMKAEGPKWYEKN
jgi:hypothetical protein